jgi:NADPH2:quinone reductase
MRGAFAEQVALPATATLPLAPSLAFPTAAAVPMTYGTAYHALVDRAQLRAGETLLVLGAAGGIGTAAVELGKLIGATVIAAASSPAKLAVAQQYGADATIDYVRDDLRARLNEITAGRGIDVVVDPVGGAYTEPALRAMSWGGRYLVIGFAAGEIPRIRLNLTLLKGCAVVGVYWGEFRRRNEAKSRADLARLLEYAGDERIRPLVSAAYPLAEAGRALADVYERRAVGKIVIEP